MIIDFAVKVGTQDVVCGASTLYQVAPRAPRSRSTTFAWSPLNVAAMYWAWGLGHKFLRLDIAVEGSGGVAGWDVHLGSALCDSPGPTLPPENERDRINRATISLTDFDARTDTVVLDLAALLADSDLSTDAGGSPGCQSFPDDAGECTPLFPNLGLDFATGDCVDGCQGQSAFRIE